MKTVLHITLITLLLSAGEMHAAQPAAPPKAEANGNKSKPDADAEAEADAAAAAKEAKE